MSDSDEQRPAPAPPPAPPAATALGNTPNAEKYVLEADAMRRRQLRSALLHGSRRTWREHKRAWPPVAVGFVVVAVIIAGMAVMDALEVTQQNQQKQEQQQREQMKEQQKQKEQQKRELEQQRKQQQQQEQEQGPQRSPSEVPTAPVSPGGGDNP